MKTDNVIPFPQVINPMQFMQMPKVTTELLRDELIDLDSYARIAAAMAADVTFLFSIANDFFTEQFDSESMANIAGLLEYMAGMVAAQGKDPDSGNATDLEMDLQSASIKLSRLADRLSAMKSSQPLNPA